MKNNYVLSPRFVTTEQDYSTSTGYKCTINQKDATYRIIIKWTCYTSSSSSDPKKDNIGRIDIRGKYPDGTEFTLTNAPTTYNSSSNKYQYNCRTVIEDNALITENIGSVPMLICMYDKSGSLIQNAQFQAVIRNPLTDPLDLRAISIGFKGNGIPQTIKVSQGSTNTRLSITISDYELMYKPNYYARAYLAATRPDKRKITATGNLNYTIESNSSSPLFQVGTSTFVVTLPEKFTEIPGAFDAQVVICRTNQSSAGYLRYIDDYGYEPIKTSTTTDFNFYELRSEKIRFIVEPIDERSVNL